MSIPTPSPPSAPVSPAHTIPSTGLTYWHHRRAAFLAGTPFPAPTTPAPLLPDLPQSYTVCSPPPPRVASPPEATGSLARLEALLEFEDSEVAWNGGVGGVHRNLTGGRRLAKGMRLGLVIKVLRAGWVRDGTWPVDSRGRPMPAPDSPFMDAAPGGEVEPLDLESGTATPAPTGTESAVNGAAPER